MRQETNQRGEELTLTSPRAAATPCTGAGGRWSCSARCCKARHPPSPTPASAARRSRAHGSPMPRRRRARREGREALHGFSAWGFQSRKGSGDGLGVRSSATAWVGPWWRGGMVPWWAFLVAWWGVGAVWRILCVRCSTGGVPVQSKYIF